MGRGRAKAKQTKVARELKYSSPTPDLKALERELSGENGGRSDDDRVADSYDSYRHNDDDEYDEYRR